MPSTYAHYRFGREVLDALPTRLRAVIKVHPQLFLIGLHGPDIFFYYNPFRDNPLGALGGALHDAPAEDFFETARVRIREAATPHERDAALSYALGFLCHFALDHACHGYIEEYIAETGVSHNEIETEFDRALMVHDGLRPICQQLTDHLVPSEENAAVIAPFFPQLTAAQVRRSIASMVRFNRLLVAPQPAKRTLVCGAMLLSGHYRSLRAHMISRRANPLCRASNKRLYALYREARLQACDLLEEYDSAVVSGAPLNPYLRHTFGPA